MRRDDLSSSWVVGEMVAPIVNVTVAALWRDLRLGGQEALLQMRYGELLAEYWRGRPEDWQGEAEKVTL